MKDNLEKLQEVIIQQQKKIDEMQSKIIELSDYILRLSVCKLTNPKYPYYDFIVSTRMSPEKQSKIDVLFLLLSEMFDGKKMRESARRIEDYPTDFLFSNEPPKYKDVSLAITNILGATSGELSLEVIKKLKEQGFYVEVCDYLLNQYDINNENDE